ncbi:hypothetical protein V8C86DRAFT_3149409 [Haematococcus lacustris]
MPARPSTLVHTSQQLHTPPVAQRIRCPQTWAPSVPPRPSAPQSRLQQGSNAEPVSLNSRHSDTKDAELAHSHVDQMAPHFPASPATPEEDIPVIAATLTDYLHAADALELSYAALLADLSNVAYGIESLTAEALLEQHGLSLVCSSSSAVQGPMTREAWFTQLKQQRSSRPLPLALPLISAAGSTTSAQSQIPPAPLPTGPPAPPPLAASALQRVAEEGAEAEAQEEAVHQRGWTREAETVAVGPGLGAAAAGAACSPAGRGHRLSLPGGSPLLTPSISMVSLSSIDDTMFTATLDGPLDSCLYHYPLISFIPSPQASQGGAAPDPPAPALPAQPVSSPGSGPLGGVVGGAVAAMLDQAQGGAGGCGGGAGDSSLPPPFTAAAAVVHVEVLEGSEKVMAGGEGEAAAAGQPGLAVGVGGGGDEGRALSPQATAVTSRSAPPRTLVCLLIVIQGSTSLDHWRINTQFEPVLFEDPALGVRVHRGVYQAALQMYPDIVPLVRSHLVTSPGAKVTLTGHSLGGSLATLLQLLLVHRGELPAACAAPLFTFGTPAIFCGGAGADAPPNPCSSCSLPCPEHHHHPDHPPPNSSSSSQRSAHHPTTTMATLTQRSASLPWPGPPAATAAAAAVPANPLGVGAPPHPISPAPSFPPPHPATPTLSSCPSPRSPGLLAALGLPSAHITNVIMHRDIVPRAFACDYTSVAGLLQRLMPAFKGHSSLQGPAHTHKSLYSFLGRVSVLRPSPACAFAYDADEGMGHLPLTPGLYHMAAPLPAPLPPLPSTPAPPHSNPTLAKALSSREGAPAAPPAGTSSSSSSLAGFLPLRLLTPAGDFDFHDLLEDALAAHIASHPDLQPCATTDPAPPPPHALSSPLLVDKEAGWLAGVGNTPEVNAGQSGRSAGQRAGGPASGKTGAVSKAGKAGSSSSRGAALCGPSSLRDAVLQVLNTPHPLTTLGEVSAYGPNGTISRYHNPENYGLALEALLHLSPLAPTTRELTLSCPHQQSLSTHTSSPHLTPRATLEPPSTPAAPALPWPLATFSALLQPLVRTQTLTQPAGGTARHSYDAPSAAASPSSPPTPHPASITEGEGRLLPPAPAQPRVVRRAARLAPGEPIVRVHGVPAAPASRQTSSLLPWATHIAVAAAVAGALAG